MFQQHARKRAALPIRRFDGHGAVALMVYMRIHGILFIARDLLVCAMARRVFQERYAIIAFARRRFAVDDCRCFTLRGYMLAAVGILSSISSPSMFTQCSRISLPSL